ncbi:hypothetical protein LJC32_01430 [Oscillospiraceae bacterium OttesenSCG-928-F05]|nr:hypothetical protein [Oscillospiraceae bacterium OttesenSCG-928-F05]
MEDEKKTKLLHQLDNMQRLTLPSKKGGYTVSEVMNILNDDLNLMLCPDFTEWKTLAQIFRRKLRGKPYVERSKRKRYYATAYFNVIINDEIRSNLLNLAGKQKLIQEYEKYEKAAWEIAVDTTGRKPQQRPEPEPLSAEEARQQEERLEADTAFHQQTGNFKKQKRGTNSTLNKVFDEVLNEATERCLLDALNRLPLDHLKEIFEFDEERLAQDTWNALVADDTFPDAYDLAAMKRLKEPSNYYNVDSVEAFREQLSRLEITKQEATTK